MYIASHPARPIQLHLPLPYFQSSVFITGNHNPTPEMLIKARTAAGRAWRHNQRIIVADGYGIDTEIIRLADQREASYDVYGTAHRPKNGTSMRHYTRLKCGKHQRDMHLVTLADIIIIITDGQQMSLYNYAKTFRHKITHLIITK